MEAIPPSCLAPAGAGGSAVSSLFPVGIWDAKAATGAAAQPSPAQLSGTPHRPVPPNGSTGVTVRPTITRLGSAPLAKLYISMENNRLLCLPKVEIIPIERHLTGM